jgi:hypothetical protein
MNTLLWKMLIGILGMWIVVGIIAALVGLMYLMFVLCDTGHAWIVGAIATTVIGAITGACSDELI